MEQTYRTGEVAELFGITKEGVRYLEREGIIASSRSRINGYRTYGRLSVSMLKLTRTCQRLGLSLEDIRDSIRAPSAEKAASLMERSADELQQKIEEEQRLLCELRRRSELLKEANLDAPPIRIMRCPAMLFLPRLESEENAEEERTNEAAWTREMPPVSLAGHHLTPSGETVEGYGMFGSIVSEEDALRLHLPLDSRVVPVPAGLCLCGTAESPLKGSPDLSPFLRYAEENGYVLNGDTYARLLLICDKNAEDALSIHEIRMPVRKK